MTPDITFDFRVEIAQIKRCLKRVSEKQGPKVIRPAMKAALKQVLVRARQEAPFKKGNLRNAIKIVAARRRKGRIAYLVQQRAPEGSENKGYYPAPITYGKNLYSSYRSWRNKSNRSHKKWKGEKKTKPNPYMKRAFKATGSKAMQDSIKNIIAGFDKLVASSSK